MDNPFLDQDYMHYDYLHSLGNEPRLHGNGFIQLDLDDGKRLHVWDPALEGMGQMVRTGIHDHRFSYHSLVVYGRQVHQEYRIVVGFDLRVYEPQRREGTEDTKLVPSDPSKVPDVRAIVGNRLEIPAGFSYTFEAKEFHDSIPLGLTATIMTKTHVDRNHTARVLVPIDEEPDNEFDRESVDKAMLWDSIRRVCRT